MTGGRAPKRAGDAWERAVVAYLREHGYPYADRAYGAGRADDRGDIDGVAGWVLQCKATREVDVAAALAAAERQLQALPDRRFNLAAGIVKRRNHSTGEAYVVMTLATFAVVATSRPTEAPAL